MYNARKPVADDLPSTAQLLRSTVIAAAAAGLILVTVVLPAEYGIDPTGIGRVLGLTQMGETKLQLAREAAEEEAAGTANVSSAPAAPPTTPGPTASPPATAAATAKSEEVAVTLAPGAAAEVKIEMRKGRQIRYNWTAGGGRVNYDLHGDPYDAPKSFYHGYDKGRGAPGGEGILEAAFDGHHGWFWRNRTKQNVTVTLRVDGDYISVTRVL